MQSWQSPDLGVGKWKIAFLTIIGKNCINFGADATKVSRRVSWVSQIHLVSGLIVAVGEQGDSRGMPFQQ